jgi:hypothetical protein
MSEEKAVKISFPWSAFLSQPVFDPKFKLILNPHKFQYIYNVLLLEACLQRRCTSADKYRKLSG